VLVVAGVGLDQLECKRWGTFNAVIFLRKRAGPPRAMAALSMPLLYGKVAVRVPLPVPPAVCSSVDGSRESVWESSWEIPSYMRCGTSMVDEALTKCGMAVL